jgi:hypothetical protein
MVMYGRRRARREWSRWTLAHPQWISFGVLLATIRYGHHWRETANKKYGYEGIAEDEKHPESVRGSAVAGEEEAGVVSVTAEDDTHTDLPPRPPAMRGSTGLERIGSGKTARVRPQGGLPDAEGMLYRQTSLTGSVVHGGG